MTRGEPASLADVQASTAALLRALDDDRWSDADLREPSLLPAWTRAHVLSHIALQADSITRTLSGALRGEIVARYPGGKAGRAADIEVGARAGSTQLIADVRTSADRLDRAFAEVTRAAAWSRVTEDGRPASDWVYIRWPEVEVHRIDLNGDYGPTNWPAAFVRYLIPRAVERLTGTDLHVEVQDAASTCTDLIGRKWSLGTGETTVAGPDWAVAAWATGRGVLAQHELTATPDVPPWHGRDAIPDVSRGSFAGGGFEPSRVDAVEFESQSGSERFGPPAGPAQ